MPTLTIVRPSGHCDKEVAVTRSAARWAVTVLVSIVSFPAVWILCVKAFGQSSDTASAIAGAVVAVATLPLAAWASTSSRASVSPSSTSSGDFIQAVAGEERLALARRLGRLDVSIRWRLNSIEDAEERLRAGSQQDIADLFESLARPQLCITGEPGIGKTVLALVLAQQLHDRRPGSLPVVFNLGAWQPAHEAIESYLARQLSHRFEAPVDPDDAAALVVSGRILPILDGLDELDSDWLPGALNRIASSKAVRRQFVLVCRAEEYVIAGRLNLGTELPVVEIISSTITSREASGSPAVPSVRPSQPMPPAIGEPVLEEVMALPEVALFLAGDAGKRATFMLEVQKVLDEQAELVLERANEQKARFDESRQRMIAGMPRPAWTRLARRFQIVAWVAAGLWSVAASVKAMPQEALPAAAIILGGISILAPTVRRLSRYRWQFRTGRWSLVLAAVTAGAYWIPRAVVDSGLFRAGIWIVAGIWLLSLLSWLSCRPYERLKAVLSTDFPELWRGVPDVDAYRVAAEQAREDWISALARDGVMPLLRSQVTMGQDRYGTTLPFIDAARLGAVSRLDQLVSSPASDLVAWHIEGMASASIGVSGPRGAGKSTVLQRFCEPKFTRTNEDLLVLVSAPTGYDRREFLIHLFGKICEKVAGPNSSLEADAPHEKVRSRLRRFMPALAAGVGLVIMYVALQWEQTTQTWQTMLAHKQTVAVVGGIVLVLGGLIFALLNSQREAERRRSTTTKEEALVQLRRLRYQMTRSTTEGQKLTLPGGLEVSVSGEVQHAEHIRSYPELVADFRAFLTTVALERRRHFQRVVIGVDELDQIGTSAEAERFLNDLKAIFGIQGCYFLVSVSEDALEAFDRRALAVRTVFDSAFDGVVRVAPQNLGQAREMLNLRGVFLPEPFLWLCHALSGGLPRDLLRCVLNLAISFSTDRLTELDDLARRLIRQDVSVVLSAQLRQVEASSDHQAATVGRWLAEVIQAAATDAFLDHLGELDPPASQDASLRELSSQSHAYLLYAKELWETFAAKAIRWYSQHEQLTEAHMELLASVRASLAASSELAHSSLKLLHQQDRV